MLFFYTFAYICVCVCVSHILFSLQKTWRSRLSRGQGSCNMFWVPIKEYSFFFFCSNRCSFSFTCEKRMPHSVSQINVSFQPFLKWPRSAHLLSCSWVLWGRHWALSVAELIASPFMSVQVFGDYYHFRHHAVEKRALSGHRGTHNRLEKEPKVKLLSVLAHLISTLLYW